MRPIALAVFAAFTACTTPPAITERAPAERVHRPPDRVPPASIHGAAITDVAIDERGDAAASVDAIGEARLWPALDGTREPVTLHALDGSRAISIAGNGDGLIAAGLDAAGNATLARVTREGALRGTAKLAAGEAAIVQVVAIEGGVLVRRSDQSIERYDAGGAPRGRLVADPGERLGAVAVRRGAAAAFVLGPPPPQLTSFVVAGSFAAGVRAIALEGGALAWGERHSLPQTVAAHNLRGDALALSPNHTRVAVADFSGILYVLDAADLHEIAHVGGAAAIVPVLGFTDEDDAVEIGRVTVWWRAHGDQRSAFMTMSSGAVGDGIAIAPEVLMLALVGPEQVRYLGWSKRPDSTLAVAGDHVALVTALATDRGSLVNDMERGLIRRDRDDVAASAQENSAALLDDHLQVWQTRVLPGVPVAWIDERHAVCAVSGDDGTHYVVADLEVPRHDIDLGAHAPVGSVVYDRVLRELAMYEASDIVRFTFDAQLTTATALPMLQTLGGAAVYQLVDPATHDGIVAYQVLGGGSLLAWHEGSGTLLQPAPVPAEGGPCVTLDLNGNYVVGSNGIAGLEHANVCKPPIALADPMRVVVRSDGERIAAFDGRVFAMYDLAGRQLWQRPLWSVSSVVFSPDRREVVASAAGGLVALDADTGERIASTCAFEFGIHDDPAPAMGAFSNAPTECEE